MAANARNRSEARNYLASLLTTALVGTGLPVQSVYAWNSGAWQHQSPVVVVFSGGSKRQGRYLGSEKYRNTSFMLMVSVTLLDTDEAANWDALDDIERRIANVVMDNKSSSYWQDLQLADGYTEIDSIEVKGVPYISEMIAIEARPIFEPA